MNYQFFHEAQINLTAQITKEQFILCELTQKGNERTRANFLCAQIHTLQGSVSLHRTINIFISD